MISRGAFEQEGSGGGGGGASISICARVYEVNPVSRVPGEVSAVFLGTWGPGFDQEAEGWGGRAGQLNL